MPGGLALIDEVRRSHPMDSELIKLRLDSILPLGLLGGRLGS